MLRLPKLGWAASILLCTSSPLAIAAPEPVTNASTSPAESTGRIEIPVGEWPKGGRLEIPWTGQLPVAANLTTSPHQFVYAWEMAQDGQHLRLLLQQVRKFNENGAVWLEALQPNQQLTDGRVQFPLSIGKAEALPGTTKSWSWELNPTRAGTYTVEVTAASPKAGGEVVEVGFDKEWAMGMIQPTGKRTRYIQTSIGRLHIPDAQSRRLYLRLGEGEKVTGSLYALSMRPTSESGRLIGQDASGNVHLRAEDAILLGQHARLDSTTKTVVDWKTVSDALGWEFNTKRPGTFAAEIRFQPGTLTDGTQLELSSGNQKIPLRLEPNQDLAVGVGDLNLSGVGDQRVTLRLLKHTTSKPLELREIRLLQKSEDLALKQSQ